VRTVPTILLVESDRELGRSLTEQLTADGYRVELARGVEHARMLARASAPKLALLGGLDGSRGALALLEEIRAGDRGGTWQSTLPAIVLGERTRELDLLRAFESGADDYIARSVGYLEFRGVNFNSRGSPSVA